MKEKPIRLGKGKPIRLGKGNSCLNRKTLLEKPV